MLFPCRSPDRRISGSPRRWRAAPALLLASALAGPGWAGGSNAARDAAAHSPPLAETVSGVATLDATRHLPPATDLGALAAAAAARREPLVLLISLPDCRYCEIVRRNYLAPLAHGGSPAVRELDMTAATPVRSFDGRTVSARDWVRQRGVRVAPTVLFLDRQGRAIAPALVGVQPDFYGAYLEQALDQARAALQP